MAFSEVLLHDLILPGLFAKQSYMTLPICNLQLRARVLEVIHVCQAVIRQGQADTANGG